MQERTKVFCLRTSVVNVYKDPGPWEEVVDLAMYKSAYSETLRKILLIGLNKTFTY